ncbi:MAG: hypothetical protein NC338_02585 [Firmicutes bacterium]|nr:hypothetical protein [Bacillota bacterium]MCM1400721.1 hypothetical protein [Bacteroides sp.]MCM1476415.1 hypothetical protein [Bacteroides sp.]
MPAIDIILITVSVLLALWSIGSSFASWRWAAATAYVALWPLYYLPQFVIPDGIMTFWGIATLIALGINYMLPFEISSSRRGMAYMAGGSLCGTFVGMIAASQAGMICGAALGALCGAIAYSRTPRGRVLDFPSSRFFNYVLAKGLPLIVVMSTVGLVGIAIYQFFTLDLQH